MLIPLRNCQNLEVDRVRVLCILCIQVISQSYCQVFVKSYNFVFEKIDKEGSPWKVTKTRPFLSTCYGYPSTTEVPPCCQAATKKLTFSTTSVLLLLNVPLSLSRGTVFRRQTNPSRGFRPKIAGILFVSNEPEGKYYTVPSICSCWPRAAGFPNKIDKNIRRSLWHLVATLQLNAYNNFGRLVISATNFNVEQK